MDWLVLGDMVQGQHGKKGADVNVRVCVCICVYVCVYVCVCLSDRGVYIYRGVCACVRKGLLCCREWVPEGIGARVGAGGRGARGCYCCGSASR